MGGRFTIVSYATRSLHLEMLIKRTEGRGVKHARVLQDTFLLYIRRREDAAVQNDDVDWIMALNIKPQPSISH